MQPVVLFDGVCNLCNGAVNFIIDHDPEAQFRFGALQSEGAKELLRHCRLPDHFVDNIVLVEEGACYERSTAALRIARRLAGPSKLLYLLIILPIPIRDALYGWIARNRYRWFGKRDSCRMPTPGLRMRFID